MSKRSNPVSVFQPEFREDLAYWVRQDRKIALRILKLVEAVTRDPFDGIGKPEPLRAILSTEGRPGRLRTGSISLLDIYPSSHFPVCHGFDIRVEGGTVDPL